MALANGLDLVPGTISELPRRSVAVRASSPGAGKSRPAFIADRSSNCRETLTAHFVAQLRSTQATLHQL